MNRDFVEEREHLVETQSASRGIRDPWVLHAMRTVPREYFVSQSQQDRAYDDGHCRSEKVRRSRSPMSWR